MFDRGQMVILRPSYARFGRCYLWLLAAMVAATIYATGSSAAQPGSEAPPVETSDAETTEPAVEAPPAEEKGADDTDGKDDTTSSESNTEAKESSEPTPESTEQKKKADDQPAEPKPAEEEKSEEKKADASEKEPTADESQPKEEQPMADEAAAVENERPVEVEEDPPKAVEEPPKEEPKPKKDPPTEKCIIGSTATLVEKQSGLKFRARVDTGAKSCSLHVEKIKIQDESTKENVTDRMTENIGKVITFEVKNGDGKTHILKRKIAGYVIIKTSNAKEDGKRRYKVPLTFKWKNMEKEVLVTLNNRSHMEYPLLIGRNFLRGDFLVDVAVDSDD